MDESDVESSSLVEVPLDLARTRLHHITTYVNDYTEKKRISLFIKDFILSWIYSSSMVFIINSLGAVIVTSFSSFFLSWSRDCLNRPK